MKILSNKKYNEIMSVICKQHEVLIKQDKLITKLNKENSILNHAIAAHNIDFPNSSVRSTDLFDPIDKLF